MESTETSEQCRHQDPAADGQPEGRRVSTSQQASFEGTDGASLSKGRNQVHWGSSASGTCADAKQNGFMDSSSNSCSREQDRKQPGLKHSGDPICAAISKPMSEVGQVEVSVDTGVGAPDSSTSSRHSALIGKADGNSVVEGALVGSVARPETGPQQRPVAEPTSSSHEAEGFASSARFESDSPLSSASKSASAQSGAPRVEDSGLGSCGASLSSERLQRASCASSESRASQRGFSRGASQQAPVSVQTATAVSEGAAAGGKQLRRLSPNQWVAALFKPTGEFRLAKILSVRAFGETGSHLPDEVLQPAAARQSKHKSHPGGLKSEGGGAGSSCKAGKSCKVAGSSRGIQAGHGVELATQREAHPRECEYYVHYRHTNRRLDCWLPFEDILPVNSQGQVLQPPVACRIRSASLPAVSGGTGDGVDEKGKCGSPSAQQRLGKRPSESEGRDLKRVRLRLCEDPGGENLPVQGPPMESSPAEPQPEFCLTNGDANRGSEAKAIALWKSFASPGCSDEEQLKVLMFDPSLAFSDHDDEEHEGMDSATLAAHEEATRVKTIAKVFFGSHELEAWYFSPFPAEAQAEQLHICEFCLTFFVHASELQTHATRCTVRHPPGNEIYRDGHLSMFEVDGKSARVYSENLCFLAKLFLDHKTLQFDVEPFLFYVLTEVDDAGCHLIGYFSKHSYTPTAPAKRDLVRATAIRPQDIQRTLEEIGVLRYLQGHHVLLLHPDLIKIRLKEAGSGGIPVYPEKLHFTPYNQGPPQANEVMPAPTAEETGE